jgi:hypothetical protein
MGASRFVVFLGLAVVLTVLLSAGSVGAQSGATIEVQANGASVADGDRVVVPSANLSTTVSANRTIQSVVVLLDDERIHEASQNATEYAVSLDPDFSSRSNQVQVLLKDEAGTLWTHQITVYKDDQAPDIGLEEPFTASPGYRFPSERSVDGAAIRVSGTVEDASSVTEFNLRIVGGGRSVEVETLSDGAFSLNTTLSPGNNSLILTATDEYGHQAHRSTRLTVTDEAEPAMQLRNWPRTTRTGTIRPTILATDDVAVDSIRYRIPGQPERTVLESTGKLLDAGRTNVTVEPTLTFPRDGTYNVTVNVTDTVGNFVEKTVSVTYDPVTPAERAKPTVSIDANRSGLYNDSVYRLNASVTDGIVRSVFLAATDSSGRVTQWESIYDGPNASTVRVERDVPIDPGKNEIRLTVTDGLNATHEYTIRVDTANASSYEPPRTTVPALTATTAPETTEGPPTSRAHTEISVTESTPLSPVTETTSPLSPWVTVLAMVLSGFLLSRRSE